MTSPGHLPGDYTALSDKMTYLTALRVGLALIVLAWSAVRPEALGTTFEVLGLVTAGYVATTALLELVRRRLGQRGVALLGALLLVDGLYLACAMYATGGTQSSIGFLVYLHLVAVSLLASYRTGLKIALWHSLLQLVVLYAQAAQVIRPIEVVGGQDVAFDRMPVLNITAFWLFALATSAFSAMNERELRHGRADLQTLVDLSARLDDVSDPVQQSTIVLELLADRFGFGRGLVLGASGDQVTALASRGCADHRTAPGNVDAIVGKAVTRRDLLAIKRINPDANPLLAAAMPEARNLLVCPMIADGQVIGAIVLEHRSRNLRGVERRVASVVRQVSAVAALNMRSALLLRDVRDLAERDPLTGTGNRRTFQLMLERELQPGRIRAGRAASSTAVLYIDLDDFKVVNDTLGHAVGDALLVAVASRISNSTRDGDVVARLGGDEFAVLTSDSADLERTLAIANRLVRELGSPYQIGEHSVAVTASIGIASSLGAGEVSSDLMRNADAAMYMAKANGKASFAVFDPEMHAVIRERNLVGTSLQRLVELDQLRLVYQPIIDLQSGRVAGVEALVRWQDPERGLVGPASFIEIAEENGAIFAIGRWVLREACTETTRWGPEQAGIFLAVNVSARELGQPGFVQAVQATLADTGLDPTRLHLEITETALLKANASTVSTLESLRGLGIRIAIDDFGTGYFSLSHLRQFPIDALKIAREFVQAGESDAKSAALASAIVALGHSLGILTVAEGIETPRQADRMRSLGCTFGQGYFFSHPVSAAEIEGLAMRAAAARPAIRRRLAGRTAGPAATRPFRGGPSPSVASAGIAHRRT